MPPKKKPTSSKKKAKQTGGAKKPAADAKPSPSESNDVVSRTAKIDVVCTKPNISIECANAFAALFSADYPPTLDIDYYEQFHLTAEEEAFADRSYSECSRNFNRGNDLINQKSRSLCSTNTRWHLAQQAHLDALESAMKSHYIFLKTTGRDHRNLLCKVTLSIAQCRGNLLDVKGMIAWGKAAIAVDPKYYNGYAKYALGLLHDRRYEEALQAYKKAQSSEGIENALDPDGMKEDIKVKINALQRIVNAEPNSKEWKAGVRFIAEQRRMSAVTYYQECNLDRPKKSCVMCWWPAEERNLRCSKCLTVYYCHQNCQYAHWREHKHSCVASKRKDTEEVNFPEPDYPRSEWAADEHYNIFKQNSRQLGCDMIHTSANSCSVEMMKRALMQEKDAIEKINSAFQFEYPIHRAALRNEPNAAIEICKILIKHGACPNVYRGDSVHLLDICRGRARWIDDEDPSLPNHLFRLTMMMSPGSLEEEERNESSKLVELIKDAIKNHKRCRHCKKQEAAKFIPNQKNSPHNDGIYY
jgi:tetratricopeptide (TPR) repeat protein